MKSILDIGVLFVVALMTMTVGMELVVRQFRILARPTACIALTLVGQIVVLPTLGLGLAHALALPSHSSAGIMLIAACPIGDIANFYVLLSRGNLALSAALNTVSIVFSAATMAIVFETYRYFLGTNFGFTVPGPMLFLRLTLILVLPLLAGMVLRFVRPNFISLHRTVLHRIVIAGIVCLLATVLVSQRQHVAAEWQQTAAVAAIFMVLAMATGLALARLLRLSEGDGITVGVGYAVRNVAMATAVAITLFDQIEYAVFPAVYFLTEVPLLFGIVCLYRKWRTLAAQST
jgi:bile acid:Na+ symporter, BASS family